MPENNALLKVDNLVKHFPIRSGFLRRVVGQVRAVDNVSFSIQRGETLGLVGESGCGKTTVGRTLLRLIPATSGSVRFEGQEVLKASRSQTKSLRRQMQIVFQDPFGSLNPRLPIGDQIEEGLLAHKLGDENARGKRVREVLDRHGVTCDLTWTVSAMPFRTPGGRLLEALEKLV